MKLPRDVSGPEAVKALRRLGFTVTRQDGSHIRLSKGGLHVTVPNPYGGKFRSIIADLPSLKTSRVARSDS